MKLVLVGSRVSNATAQCNFLGQRLRDRRFFFVPGQWDNRTSSKSCHGTGQDSLSKSGTGHGTGQSLFLRQNWGWDKDGTGQSLFFSMISYFRTSSSCFRASFPVLEPPSSVLEPPSPVLEPPFPGESDCAPGFFLLPLSRDKGTTGQGIIFVPSLGNPSWFPCTAQIIER